MDGVAGQLLALSCTVVPLWRHEVPELLTGAWPGWVVPFVLFRLFDIWKPWPVRSLEKIPGGAGIVLDDVGAGIYAALVLLAAGWFNR